MSKLRVHELAKELNKPNKELLDFLKAKNVDVKSHMSSLSEDQIDMVKKAMSGNEAKPEKTEKPEVAFHLQRRCCLDVSQHL